MAFAVVILSMRQPDLWLAIAFAAGILPQSVFGDHLPTLVAFSDLIAVLMLLPLLPSVALRRIRPSLGPIAVSVACFLLVSLITSLVNWRGNEAVTQLTRMAEFAFLVPVLFVAFLTTPSKMERCFNLLLIADAVLGVAAIVGFAAGARNGLYILGMHKNAIGPSLGCGVVAGLTYLRSPDLSPRIKKWVLTAFSLSLIGTILSLSRGAWMATAAACLLVLALRRDFRGLLVMVGLAAPIFIACWSVLPADSVQYAGDISLQAHTMQFRLDHQAYALDLWREHPILGNGVGLTKEFNSENVYVQTLAESGVAGLIAFVGLLISFYVLAIRLAGMVSERSLWSANIGRVLLCCVGVFTIPTVQGFVDAYWRRGVTFLAWAAAGMCVSLLVALARRENNPPSTPRLAAKERIKRAV
jgi:O-antigen ligase